MYRYLSHSHHAFVPRVLPESASPWLLRATLFRSCSVLSWVDLSSAGVGCFMLITEPSLPLTVLLGLSFESSDLSVLPLGKLFRKVLYSNTRIPSAASYLGNCFIFFELLQFLSTGVTLWSAFCWDGRMGFWAYSRILKYERNFQVGDSVKSCTWLLCDTALRNAILFIAYVSVAVWSWVLYNLPDKMRPTWTDAQGSFESWGGFHV